MRDKLRCPEKGGEGGDRRRRLRQRDGIGLCKSFLRPRRDPPLAVRVPARKGWSQTPGDNHCAFVASMGENKGNKVSITRLYKLLNR